MIVSKIYTINPYTQIIGDGGDNYEYFAFQNLVRENIQHGKYPLGWTDTLRYPVGFDLGLGYDGAMVVFTGGILGLFIPLPLAYNFTIVIVLFLNFLFSYLLFRKLSHSELVGVFVAIIYGFSPYVMARISSHLNLAFIGGFPLFLYALLCLYDKLKIGHKFTLRNYFLLFGSILLIAAGSLQYLVLLVYLGISIFIYSLINSQVRDYLKNNLWISIAKSKNYLILFTIIFILFTFFLYGGYISHLTEIVNIPYGKYQGYAQCCIPTLLDIFIPNKYLGLFWNKLNSSSVSIEKVVTVGIIEWGILFGILFSVTNKRLKIFLLASFILFFLISKNILSIPLIPEGGRIVILFSLISFSILSSNRIFKNKIVILIMIVLLIAERFSFTLYKSPLPSRNESEIVKNQSGIGVLNIPVSKYNSYRSILPYFYQKKVIDGYFHYTAENQQTISFLRNGFIQRYICDSERDTGDIYQYQEEDVNKTLQLLKQYDIKTIVLHKTLKDKLYFDDCENVRYWWFNLNPEKLLLSSATVSVEAKTMTLSYYPILKAQIFFEKAGTFILNGFSLFPTLLTDTEILLPNGNKVFPRWENMETDLRSSFTPPISLHVDAGDNINIMSGIKVKEPIYLTIFYSFQPDPNSFIVKPPIEKIYQNQDIDIYQVN